MNRKSKPRSTNSRANTEHVNPAVERAVAKQLCETDHLFFTRYFFKHRQGIKFRVNWHHVLIADVIQRVIDGVTKNVVINVSPGSSKTEMVVINLISRGLALNPWARFLHISYSDDLALLNSETAREVVESDEYQEKWPYAIAADAKSKKRWNVVVKGKKAGGVYAVSLAGQITGFRAGHMAEGWQGAIIIDDPLKVEDAYSKTYRDKANRKLLSTVKSRKANPDTPIIVIMQRLAEEDPTGFIKEGNLPGEWEFVEIPALITDEYVAALPERVRKLVELSDKDKDGRFSYWPYKEPLADQLDMERVAPYVHSGQYMQRPSPLGGGIIKAAWFPRYPVLPRILYRKIFVDTAQKTAERNDYSVFQCWGAGDDGRIYLLDQIRDKWEAPDLRQAALDFWAKHKPYDHRTSGPLREMVIEDKASGTGLIQDIKKHGFIPVRPLPRDTDKLLRVMDVNSYWAAGLAVIPESAPWVLDFVNELNAFTADDTHAHDDQIDPLVDATTDMLANASDWSAWN